MEIIKNFKKDGKCLEVYGTYDEPMFKAKQVGEALGYGNIRSSLKSVDKEWKITKVHTMDNGKPPVRTTYLKEAGLYFLLVNSRKAEAKAFRNWVLGEVLPTIRKTGSYTISDHPIRKKLTFNIQTEEDLQCKVVNFIKNQYPNSIFVSTLGENQITDELRIKSHKMGYLKGSPDLIITNLHKRYTGFAIEFKSPTGRGKVSDTQLTMLEKYKMNNKKVLLSNDYDECLLAIIDYFKDVRIGCQHCCGKFKTQQTLGNHLKYFHRIN